MTRIVRPFACLLAVTGAVALLPTSARAQFFPSLPTVGWPKQSEQIDSSRGKLPPLTTNRADEPVRYVFAWEKRDLAEMTERHLAPLPWRSVEVDSDMDYLTRSASKESSMKGFLLEQPLPEFPPLKITPRDSPQTPHDLRDLSGVIINF